MAFLPPISFDEISNPKAYEPGYVESSLLAYLVSEYESDRTRMEPIYETFRTVKEMANGWFIRRPADDSDLADMYVPMVAMKQRTALAIHMGRLIPDPSTMDWVQVVLSGDFPEGTLERVKEESGDPEMSNQQASEDIAARWTLLLRQALRNSNYLDCRWEMGLNRRRYGGCYGIVDSKLRMETFTADSQEAAELAASEMVSETETMVEAMLRGDDVDFGGEEAQVIDVASDEPVHRLVFDGMDFVSISPFNLSVGNLECSDGVTGLPYVTIYGRKTWDEMWDTRLMADKSGTAGRYANLECLQYESQTDVPSNYDTADQSEWTDSAQNLGMQVPLRIGKFRAAAVDAFRSRPPTKKELREFAKKFGITVEQLETVDSWAIEWVHEDGAPQMLLRFQPWHEKQESGSASDVVESRYWVIDGRTFAFGDHMAGASELEILGNDALQNLATQSQRISDPMYTVDYSSIRKDWLQERKGLISYVAGGIIPLSQPPMTGKVMEAVAPPTDTVSVASNLRNVAESIIQQYTGVAPQLEGASGGADSATEAASQADYLEQAIRADMLREEMEIDQPMLRRALAILVEEVNSSGGVEVIARGEDMKLWPDRFGKEDMIKFTLTPDMVCRQFGVKILTSSSMGNRDERLTRLERMITMLANYYQICMMEGKEPQLAKFLQNYANELGVADAFKDLTPQEKQMMAMRMMAQQGGGGGSDGGAGGTRPGYERTAAEVSAPGEPVDGMPLDSPTPGVML